jgi:hypothetical protein
MHLSELKVGAKVVIATSHVNKELHGLIGEVVGLMPAASFPVFVNFSGKLLHLLPQELKAVEEKVVKRIR